MDEDGVDVVEAIDAWIDEQIEDLTDDELELILEILDAVSASELADLDVDDVYIDDVDHLVDDVGGSAANRDFTEAVLRGAFFDEPIDGYTEATRQPDTKDTDEGDQEDADPDEADADLDDSDSDQTAPGETESDEIDADEIDPDEIDVDEPAVTDADIDLDGNDLEASDAHSAEVDPDTDLPQGEHEPDADETEPDTDLPQDEHEQDIDETDPNEADEIDLDDSDFDVDDSGMGAERTAADDRQPDSGFLADLKHAHELDEEGHTGFLADVVGTDPSVTTEVDVAATPIVALRPFDELGPTFLPETTGPTKGARRKRNVGQVLLPVFMIAGLSVFVFGMLQLISSLGEDDVEVVTELDETATAVPEAAVAPTEVPATAEPVDPSAPAPTPTPEPLPPARIGIRLVTGNVVLATYSPTEPLPEMSLLYETGDDLLPAIDVAWIDENIGVVDAEGNVLILDPNDRRPSPVMIYEAGGGFGEAAEIAAVNGLVAVRTSDGNISLTPSNGRADPDVIELVWDAEAEGVAATDFSSVDDLLPFVLDDGNVMMVVTSDDNAVVPVWSADDQPQAFNVAASPAGILLGVGEGAVARYQLGDFDGDRLESVWDPFSGDEERAIGYSPAGESTAIILGDGTIVLTDSDNSGRTLWDPTDTEIRAFVAVGEGDGHVVVLLETGSVVRIPLNPDEFIESIWDITDETLSPANQLIVEPS